MKLIGIYGHAGTGKDSVADFLCHNLDMVKDSFAAPIKTIVPAAFGIPPNWCVDREPKEREIPYWNKSPRAMMQEVGTELFRKFYGDNFWIRSLAQRHSPLHHARLVISDVRFQNEADWIISSGGFLIHLTRPGYTGNVGNPDHASEAGIFTNNYPEAQYTPIENNSTLRNLYIEATEAAIYFLSAK